MNKTFPTLVGFVAILTWAFLALLSTASGPIPPFQLAAMAFFLGGMVGVSSWIFRLQAIKLLRQPWQVWALSVAGLCIYHCAYFFAIQSAPPVEVSLIAYLWPLLIVLFASFLPGEQLRWRKEYGSLGVDQAKRLKQLETENGRLKMLVADLSLKKQVLEDIARGNL